MTTGRRSFGGAGTSRPARARARAVSARLGSTFLALVVVLGAVAVVLSGRGDRTVKVSLQDGAAWLVSSKVGQAALIDGASAQVVTQVPVAGADADLTSAQAGADAFVADGTTGSVVRVDGITYEPSRPVRFAQPGQRLQLFPGRDDSGLFAFTEQSGLVTTADIRSLQPRASQALASRIAPGGGAVDGSGRLWLIEAGSGDLVWLDDRGKVGRRAAAVDPDGARLVVAGGRAVVVAGSSVRPLESDGSLGAATCLAENPADTTAVVTGSPETSRLYTASGRRGVLLVSDLARRSCDLAADLGAADDELGPPLEVAGRVFVPDFTTGEIFVVDLSRPRDAPRRAEVLPPGTRFELVPGGSFVFYNDPASERSGVVHFDGTTISISKYDPERPEAGLINGRGSESGPPGSGQSGSPGSSAGPTSPAQSPSSTPSPTQRPSDPADGAVAIERSAGVVAVGKPVALRVVATSGARISAVRWDFDDDSGGRGTAVSHSWSRAGQYTVSAQVTLADGRKAAPTAGITVTAQPTPTPTAPTTNLTTPTIPTTPIIPTSPSRTEETGKRGPTAALTVTPASGGAPLLVNADASGSTAGSEPITDYRIDFDDNGAVATSRTGSHTYSAAGTYTVRLTVTDRAGRSDSMTRQVTVTAAAVAPTVQVSASAVAGELVVNATAAATPGTAALRDYEFSIEPAGSPESAQPQAANTARFTVPAAGTYRVTVKVTDTAELYATDTSDDVVVTVAPPEPYALIPNASSAAWSSGAGTPVYGARGEAKGYINTEAYQLEDGSYQSHMETHPNYAADGWISGQFTLPQAIVSGQRFRAQLGFVKPNEGTAGRVQFSVRAVYPSGQLSAVLLSRVEVQSDGSMPPVDVDLSGVSGATGLVLRVDALGDAAQDWAAWVNPRVE
ncbi:PKD repeat-containing protein [Parafrankia irregularis]|uniref:PKD repeat-containing protein n=1 Tax=Parafrankia irregularis TaxID=795642 RepID=A0A0S4QWG8_9ACTN|nr:MULTISPECIES: PKD domain-containing protein [Parafrankia]MBE3202513.1 PKD domain-containing protein [Parafrankia sp. CH37]CUU59561.1 PKD repeat-containing protein [Parafrankia irregularis]